MLIAPKLISGLFLRRKKTLGADEKKRGKRLFGGLLGTLDAFKVRRPYILSPGFARFEMTD